MVASAESRLPKRGNVIAGRYRIEGTLGSGGMGAVFRVVHCVTGKQFAVKWLLPRFNSESDAVQRFIREAQIAGRVDHPNVLEIYDVGQDGESFYMVMALLEGEPLAHRIGQAGRLSARDACRIMIPVTRGVNAAHAAGVIHRDLKPDNIFLSLTGDGEEVPTVLDFGISKMAQPDGELRSALTLEGAIMGTPHYMAPEQIKAAPVDARTDVYALGVILYEMLTGTLPFPGERFGEIALQIVSDAVKPVREVAPQVPIELAAVVERAMAREPDERFPSAAALGRSLEPFADGLRVDSRPPQPIKSTHPDAFAKTSPSSPAALHAVSVAPLPPTRGSRHRVWIAGGVACLTLTAAVIAWLNASRPTQAARSLPSSNVAVTRTAAESKVEAATSGAATVQAATPARRDNAAAESGPALTPPLGAASNAATSPVVTAPTPVGPPGASSASPLGSPGASSASPLGPAATAKTASGSPLSPARATAASPARTVAPDATHTPKRTVTPASQPTAAAAYGGSAAIQMPSDQRASAGAAAPAARPVARTRPPAVPAAEPATLQEPVATQPVDKIEPELPRAKTRSAQRLSESDF